MIRETLGKVAGMAGENVSGENVRWIISGFMTALGAVSAILYQSQAGEVRDLKVAQAAQFQQIATQSSEVAGVKAENNEIRRRLDSIDRKQDLILNRLSGLADSK